jgi:hypothetical protein
MVSCSWADPACLISMHLDDPGRMLATLPLWIAGSNPAGFVRISTASFKVAAAIRRLEDFCSPPRRHLLRLLERRVEYVVDDKQLQSL